MAAPPLLLHNEAPLVLNVEATEWPPAPGTLWTKQGAGVVPLLDANSYPTGYGIAAFDVTFVAPVGGPVELVTGGATGGGPWLTAWYALAAGPVFLGAAYAWRRRARE